jgi:hypothetical protein
MSKRKKSRKCSDCRGKGYKHLGERHVCVGCIDLKLDPSLVDCLACNSNGYIARGGMLFRCPKCHGRGEVDWIGQIITNPIKTLYPRPDVTCLIERYKEDNNMTYPGSVVKQGMKWRGDL